MVVGADAGQSVDRRSGVVVVSVVVALAAVMRIGPAWWRGTLGSSFGFDESVYFFGAQHVWSSSLPYRDFQFVHPPGILVGLAPFAWLAELTSDSFAMTVAKVVFSLVGAACAGLVAYLLLRYGLLAALFGGGVYAVWSAAVWSETAVMMGPILNLAMLVALVLLRRPERVVVAGVVLGVAVTVKLWAVVPLIVLAAWTAARYGWPRLVRFATGGAVAAAVIVLPFFVAGPGRMFSDVIGFQSGRPRSDTGIGERVFFFTGSVVAYHRVPLAAWWLIGVVALVLVGWALLRTLRDRISLPEWADPVWWSILALTQVVVLLAAPSFYDHYTSFAVPALCLLAGYGLHALLAAAPNSSWRLVVVAVAVVGVAVLAVMSVRVIGAGKDQPPGLGEVVAGYSCVWAYEPTVLIEADISGRQAQQECPMFVDRYAALVGEISVADSDISAALPTATRFQRAVGDQFRGSDGVLISERQLAELAPDTLAVLHTDFLRVGEVGRYQLWERADN